MEAWSRVRDDTREGYEVVQVQVCVVEVVYVAVRERVGSE